MPGIIHIVGARPNFIKAAPVVAALAEFDVIAAMRERTVFDRATLERLPNLKFMVTTGNRNASIDIKAAAARGAQLPPQQAEQHQADAEQTEDRWQGQPLR